MDTSGWVGVDLDGTLAYYDTWISEGHIGKPIEPMVRRVKNWLAAGLDVRIFTARATSGEKQIAIIRAWCKEHIGQELPVTATKDYGMIGLWDDRAIQVITNTGQPVDPAFKDV